MADRDSAEDSRITEDAWAKVNLTLQVTARRADGYHELESLVVFAEVGDRLIVAAAEGRDIGLTIAGPQAGHLLAEDDNLVTRAAAKLAERAGVASGAAVALTKNLPVASGIGGGSADAAAALRGLARLWDVGLSAEEMAALALELGADVPVCLRGAAVVMSGIGEELTPVAALPPFWLLLVNPGVAVSTAAVFRALEGNFSSVTPPRLPPAGLPALIDWLAARPNDLETPARRLAPGVDAVLAALAAQPSCLLARMSGSGATCFGMFEKETEARAAAAVIARQNEGWWVAPARLRAE